MPESRAPDIAIIIAIGDARDRAACALGSVLAQAGLERAEVIVLDCGLDRHPPIRGCEHPAVRLLQMDRHRHIGEWRAYGARIARAPLVAYLEEHAVVLADWLAGILRAFAGGPWDAVGPALYLSPQESVLSKAQACASFPAWIAPVASGPVMALPPNNSAYRRAVLTELGGELDDLFLSEWLLQERLRERGRRFYLAGDAQFIHCNESSPQAILFSQYYGNICFGEVRLRAHGVWARIRRLALLPLVPWVRTARVLPVVLRHTRSPGEAIAVAAGVLYCFMTQAAGMVQGYLGVPGRAAQELTKACVSLRDRSALPAVADLPAARAADSQRQPTR